MPRTLTRLTLLLLVVTLAGCGVFGKEIDETEGWSASKLYSEAAAELDSGNYERAIKLYEKLEARYPFGRYAMQAQLDVAYTYYRADEPEDAISAADRFIKLYPQNPYVDYAYYLKGIVNYNRSIGFLDRFIPTDPSQRDPGSAMDAFTDFSALVERFPESKYAQDARQRMVYLRNNLAHNEVNVARYYMKRGAYVAAANRANYVIERFQRTSAVDDALDVLIDAYEALGKKDLAADAKRVLELNRQAGRFIPDEPEPDKADIARKLWDYLNLDEN
ncbi:outer membrane assembly lipoprotein YfiO [Thiorhodococcus drewsii AZ1]|uniref:Outer membrane protein assembly factor BamD n=1 Tax=Thiorhodococcus drewsii AZ1 TaxID=765913 RepID=G2DYC1_9GAMM|nr:outer membrane protein assembly factor BamD [Thiorhodococcus drewsii]EGV32913.1 outer membrane assembly lipoprotein YfiO [Thiorhodococcus drewsii AZ1]